MAGIYIHVPFCKTRCDYCDFYSTTFGTEVAAAYAEQVCREIRFRKKYLDNEKITGIYFGGGTPTRLPVRLLENICGCIFENFEICPDSEITIEANPDDLNDDYVSALHALPFNRVSMGVQSFDDGMLKNIHRRHTAKQAEDAFYRLRKAGYDNVSLDLIFALPDETLTQWKKDVCHAISLHPEHLSAYALSYEQGTPLDKRRLAGEFSETSEDLYLRMYELLVDTLQQAGYEHYEISNFSLPGHRAVLNSSYWKGLPYLGIGPGAHSYDGKSCRRRNLPDVMKYIAARADVPNEVEHLDSDTLYDEMVMTRLRTCEGLDLNTVEEVFGKQRMQYLQKNAETALKLEQLEEYLHEGRRMLRLTRRGIFISNEIISDMMMA